MYSILMEFILFAQLAHLVTNTVPPQWLPIIFCIYSILTLNECGSHGSGLYSLLKIISDTVCHKSLV